MEEVYSFIPIWGWQPILVGLFVLGIDWGVIMTIRRVTEGKFYWGRWWTYRVGDSVGLPIFAAFAAVVVKDFNHPDAWYQQELWHSVVLGFGFGLSLAVQVWGKITGFFSWRTIFNPSEMYHAFIFGIMFYLMVSIMFPVVHDHQPQLAYFGAWFGVAIYVTCWAIDQTSLVDKTPDKDRIAFWEVFRSVKPTVSS